MGHTFDHVEAIFNGLPVNSKVESYAVKEIKSLLLAQEERIKEHTKELDIASIHIATH